MAYVKKVWVGKNADGSIPDNAIPISAENLNKMEDGIYEATATADNNSKRLDDLEEWIVLGSVSGSGDLTEDTGLYALLDIPCDDTIVDECNHYRLVIKAGARLYVYQYASDSVIGSCSLYIKGESLSVSPLSISIEVSKGELSREFILDKDLITEIDIVKEKSIKSSQTNKSNELSTTYSTYIDALRNFWVSCSPTNGNNTSSGYRRGSGQYSVTLELQGRR